MKNTVINTTTIGGLKRKLFGALALVALTGSYAHAATTIYEDSFNDVATNPLAGTAVQVSPNGELWQSSDEVFKADGSFTGQPIGRTYIDFTPEAGSVYSLTATMTITAVAAQNYWAGIAFYTDPIAAQGVALVAVRRDGRVLTSRNGGSFSDYDVGLWNDGQPMTANLELLLDTSGENWRIDYIVNGDLLRTINFIDGNPSISYIGIEKSAWTSGSFENIQLTVAQVPEASTTALLTLAAVSLTLIPALRRRLRR